MPGANTLAYFGAASLKKKGFNDINNRTKIKIQKQVHLPKTNCPLQEQVESLIPRQLPQEPILNRARGKRSQPKTPGIWKMKRWLRLV